LFDVFPMRTEKYLYFFTKNTSKQLLKKHIYGGSVIHAPLYAVTQMKSEKYFFVFQN